MNRHATTGSIYGDDFPAPHPAAIGLTVFRALPDGTGRQYTAVEYDRGRAGVERMIRTLYILGFARKSSADPDSGYAVLDVLDADGDIVQDYELTTRAAFEYVYRKLRLRVEPTPEEVLATDE